MDTDGFQCLTPEQVRKLYSTDNRRHVSLYKRNSPFDDPTHDFHHLLRGLQIKPQSRKPKRPAECPVCFEPNTKTEFRHLQICGHSFCAACWHRHLESQLAQNVSTKIECMDTNCKSVVSEYFALSVLKKPNLRTKYQQLAMRDCVRAHPELSFCPGPNCNMVIRAHRVCRVTCSACKSVFCFKCGRDDHAPADCEMVKKWMEKCEDDVESRNYLIAKAKSCPSCCYSIERISGCNDVRCPNCRHNFCWLCLGSHEALLRCNRVQMNSNYAVEARSREEMENYRFYFRRWENQRKSLVLEEERLVKIRRNVMGNNWWFLGDAAAAVVRCRSTLKYAVVFGYFMEDSSRKESFECQQELLEVGIEKLAWMIYKDGRNRRDLEHQVAVCEKMRMVLVDFGHRELVKDCSDVVLCESANN